MCSAFDSYGTYECDDCETSHLANDRQPYAKQYLPEDHPRMRNWYLTCQPEVRHDAAPELLAACIDMIFCHSIISEYESCHCIACERTRVAIAKARGQV